MWQAVAALQHQTQDAQAWLDAVAGNGHAAVAVTQRLLRRTGASLSEHGWSDDDIRHVVTRRLSAVHADVIAGDLGLPATVAGAVRVLLEALALVVALPEVPAMQGRDTADASLGGLDPRVLARVRALLNKAESTQFAQEAEALTAKAQELIARHAIDAVVLGDGTGGGPTARRIHLDDPYVDAKALLLGRVAGANRCTSVFAQAFGWSDVFGFPADLDAVELLTQSLLAQAAQAMAREGSRVDAAGRSRTRSFRRSFLVGFATRIGQRLQETTDVSVATAGAAHASLLPALVARDERVQSLQARTYPRTVARATSVSNGVGWAAGQAAAELADLSVAAGAVRARGSG